ncbi:hypothetical protein SDC9_83585 [bioreactor metagenome]|uniref:Uncharacterized protein n=1 Tax=bioreactor metagenome TaxID=1076179 RepID=A0A644ZAR8_9ZZZZ
MALVTNGQIDFIMSAGAFSSATVNNQSDWSLAALIILSGPLANYIFCASSGGIDQENFSSIANPAAKLTNPFAVVNLRFAVISVLTSLWNFM